MSDVMDRVNERFDKWVAYFAVRGFGKSESHRNAATYACMNRAERRRFLGERGPKRGLPRKMDVPKSR